MLRERFRSKKHYDRGRGKLIFGNSFRASDILLRTTNRRSDGEGIGKLGRRQRTRPGLGSNANSQAMRKSLGTSSALAALSHFEIWRMANTLDGTLGGTSFQKKIRLRTRKL